ncbi:unnamed protein product [Cyprideis torosa]|uniref:Uncharacterized protein n=1 Tax=Cyprideis torosa TaxID=163714 RepID=A0A7R8WFQ8_9CRUS|nr:unnamed protein product [Cyprideis torosa]CAG0897297.1 unnamed protein product [Cyprideis torosa]
MKLRRIAGLERLDYGIVRVPGGTPNTYHRACSCSPMATPRYFGRIHRIPDRSQFLRELLDFPEGDHRNWKQRRLSLAAAAALLQRPKLLILDEPTAGVQPLLRQCRRNDTHLSSRIYEETSVGLAVLHAEQAGCRAGHRSHYR